MTAVNAQQIAANLAESGRPRISIEAGRKWRGKRRRRHERYRKTEGNDRPRMFQPFIHIARPPCLISAFGVYQMGEVQRRSLTAVCTSGVIVATTEHDPLSGIARQGSSLLVAKKLVDRCIDDAG
jgi:hypothetical protein